MRAITALCVALGMTLTGAVSPAQQAGASRAEAAQGDSVSAAAAPISTRQTAFTIPFAIDASAGAGLEVELYVSVDHGAAWRLYARRPAEEKRFSFRAGGDGEYWFASRTVPAGSPAGVATGLTAELRVLVDTVEPQVEFESASDAMGQVRTSWRIFDNHLNQGSFKLSYQPAPGQPWRAVATPAAGRGAAANVAEGQIAWWPEADSRAITVRCEAADLAGNTAVSSRRIFLPRRAGGRNAPGPSASPPKDPYASVAPSVPSPGDKTDNSATTQTETAPDGRRPWPVADNSSTGPSHPSSRHDPSTTPFESRPQPPSSPGADRAPRGGKAVANYASLHGSAPPLATNAGDLAAGPPPGERPRMTNSRRFQLEYELDSIGPSGVAEVELWVTTDGGGQWRRWGADPDRQSPFDVEVQQDGVYGFRIVIVARNGLTSEPPSDGDPADIWVGVDVAYPTVRLTSALYGDGEHAGQLDIRWTAQDQRLASRPITLTFSDNPQGPWTTIATGLPNSGQYFWSIDSRVPRNIYLRIEARDEAGNVTEHQLLDPINTRGLTPQGRIRSLLPGDQDQRQARRFFPFR